MSSNFNNAKIINVYYNKGDRKPYDVNGKPIAYIGQESVGATLATKIRFFLGEQLDSSTAVVVTKRPDGERRLDICTLITDGANSYYEIELNAWYGAVKGKATLVFKVYDGEVEFDDNETPTEITSAVGRIVVSDIFNLEIAYAPEADLIVPPDDSLPYQEWFAALSTKLDKAQSIMVKPALPSSGELASNALDDRYFYVQTNGVGRLYYIDGSTPIEVVFQVGTLKLTSNGNEDINLGDNAGKMYWDEDRGTIIAGLYDDQEAGIGDTLFWFGKATEPILKGEVVQFAGNTGGNIRIKKAVFSEISAQPDLLMGVAKHDITTNNFGYVVAFGYVRNLNTTAYATPILYLSTSVDGALSSTKPTTGFKGSIAAVARPSTSGNDGFIIVRPNLVKGIGELADVTITTATNGNVLFYDGSKWVNSTRLTTAETDIDALEVRMTTEEGNVDSLEGRMTVAETDITNIENGTTVVGRALADQNGNVINSTYLTTATASATYIPLSQKGASLGVATLGTDGRVLPSQLPGSIGEVLEYDSLEDFPEVGAAEKIFIALDTNKTYRWSGTQYVEISASLALGETSETAFPGNRGLATETTVGVIAPQVAGIISGTQTLTNTRITNSAVGVVPLIVDSVPSVVSNLQEWRNNGATVSRMNRFGTFQGVQVENINTSNNSAVSLSTTGTIISRNINDTNPALIVRKQQGTGNILELQTGTSDKKLEVDVNGWFYQNGTRLFTQPVNTSNTFFGNSSGGTSTSGQFNTGVGESSLTSLTSGANNTSIGVSALRDLTTGSSNISIGSNAGRSLTTGSNNTFVGRSAGHTGAWGTQLSTASNSTALGYEAFTDKSNQMVFGNASVTEFKFDRNASAIALLPQTQITSANFPPLNIERTSNITNSGGASARFLHTTSGTIADGFSTLFQFVIKGSGVSETRIAEIGATRIGADNSGRLVFTTSNAGSNTEKMTILPNGNVGIGTGSPQRLLSLVTSSNDDGIQIRRNSTTSNDYAVLGFRINTNDLPGNFAEIRGIRTNRAVATDTDLSFHTFSNTTMTERMRIRDDGNVGIGTGSPTRLLELVTSSNDNGIQIRRNSNTSNDYANLGFRINTNESSTNYAEVRAIRTNRAQINDTDITFNTLSNLVLNERLRIRDDGLVGINETSPSAQLQVRATATDRVPLRLDIPTGSFQNITEWRTNNNITTFVGFSGYVFSSNGFTSTTSGLYNQTSVNNANITVPTTGVVISRNIADSNPALIVNLVNASSTGHIQVWQKAGSAVSRIDNRGVYYFNETKLTLTEPTFTNEGGGLFSYTLSEAQINGNDVIEITKTASANSQTFVVRVPNNSKHVRIWVSILSNIYTGVLGGVQLTKVANEFVKYVFETSTIDSANFILGDTTNNMFYNVSSIPISFIYENQNGTQKSLTAVRDGEI
jgi:hypothetical protein